MTQSPYESAIAQTEELLNHYGFELMGFTAQQLVTEWLKKHPAVWVRLAVIEALYQGRYKAISVEQILNFWSRKGDPNFHFNHEFERLICRKLPRYLRSFAYSSYNRQENQKDLYLPTSLIKKVENFIPIDKFKPPSDDSNLYVKLKEVAFKN